MKEALLYDKADNQKVRCNACAHKCLIEPGHRGKCGVRQNMDGTLQSLVYGRVVSLNIDPIEKKPLFHFLPGSHSLSIATVGCNFRCEHCQNYEISQYPHNMPDRDMPGEDMSPEEIVDAAVRSGSDSISYTYTEPTIFIEYALDTARIAKEKGIRNVFVSNGFMTKESAALAAGFIDADNIDLKGDDEFYKKVCGARLKPVQNTISLMKELGVWVEVTTLIIPGLNDSEKTLGEIAGYIASVDPEIPWHVSRFYPAYKMLDRPPTPYESLSKAEGIGRAKGLKYIYEGNVPGRGGESTVCPSCKSLLIERDGYLVKQNNLINGACYKCKTPQPGIWK